MKKTFGMVAIVMMLVMATAATTFAGFTWCFTDPNIQLPDGRGVAHLIVAVPVEYQGTQVTVFVSAPAGSKVAGNSSKNVTVVFSDDVNVDQLVAQTAAGFPVQLSVKYRGDRLGTFEFLDGTGTATWTLQ